MSNIVLFLILLIIIFIINNLFQGRIVVKDHFSDYESKMLDIIWSKGCLERNEYSLKDPDKNDVKLIAELIKNNTNSYIWIRIGGPGGGDKDLNVFARHIDKLKNPVILVTGDGDKSIPKDFNKKTVSKILNSNKIISWYTQNYDGTKKNSKIKHYPIGLDFHTPSKKLKMSIDDVYKYYTNIKQNSNKKNQIFCDSHLNHSHKERQRMKSILKNNKNIYFLKKKVSLFKLHEYYNNYLFIISPRGNGLDCHRTWEILLHGSIPIVKSSSLDDMYTRNQLPVVILKNWDELNVKNLNTKLEKWKQTYINYTKPEHIIERFKSSYWIK